MIKKYNEYIKEGLSDYLKGPSVDDLKKEYYNGNINFNKFYNMVLKTGYVFSDEELWNMLNDSFAPEISLKFSSKNGFLYGVKKSIENGADVDIYDNLPLQLAAEKGHLDIVKYLVEHGADIHVKNEEALLVAVDNGHLDIVKYLVEHGASIHAQHNYALITAYELGYFEIVKYLVEHGANIHDENFLRLKKTLVNNRLDIIAYLKEQEKLTEGLNDLLIGPSEEEIKNNLNKLEPNEQLSKSSEIGYLDGVKKALERGADINKWDDEALRLAAYCGHLDIVEYLVEHGANIHIRNETILIIAINNNNLQLVNYLVEQGANINVGYKYALINKNNHIEIIKYFEEQLKKEKLTEGLNDFLIGPNEEEILNSLKELTPTDMLFKSINSGYLKGVEIACERGADIHKQNDYALRQACEFGYEDIIKYCIDNGANIHYNCEEPLRLAVNANNINRLLLVLKYGAEVNSYGGYIALNNAKKKNKEMYSILKKYINPNIDIKDLLDYDKADDLLHQAIMIENSDVFDDAIKLGANFQIYDFQGAIVNDKYDIVRHILEKMKLDLTIDELEIYITNDKMKKLLQEYLH